MTPTADAPRRGIRSLLWGLLALAGSVPAASTAFDLSAGDVTKVGAVCAVLTAVVTAVTNALEDADVIPAFLKAPASDGANPVPDDIPGDH